MLSVLRFKNQYVQTKPTPPSGKRCSKYFHLETVTMCIRNKRAWVNWLRLCKLSQDTMGCRGFPKTAFCTNQNIIFL